ncbi:nuclear pore complex protein Nup205 [Condylostylus longicornis]|uniref:nuclear pore complex protein Nup205 n=1 Tax=Condylostylus longicornis TaxID=2530218 RepID=UPI00244E187E|nr:nuclear pore complex protein Nup205 [Condylostylus longicornis]
MAEGIPDDMWTPYKHLQSVIENSLLRPSKSNLPQIEVVLRKSKQNFASLLKNPPKNEVSRNAIKKGITEGINVPGTGNVVLSKDLVDESIILSDMYNLDENNALELLCTAQQQMIHHPGLPRGLVAILLYYDGRKALACSLRDLLQARAGVSWCTEAPKELVHLITTYTDSLISESNVLCHIIDLLSEMDITSELEILTKNRAVGPPKHHRQVLDLFEEIQLALATSLFNWSAQCGLPKNVTEKLMIHLSKYKPTESRGGMDNVTLTLLMALLYAFDASVLQRHEDIERSVQILPIISEKDYAQSIYNILKDSNWEWDNKLKSIVNFAFGLSMATLRHAPQNLKFNSEKIIENDEDIVDEAIQCKVFDFIHYYLLENELIYKTEFFYRRIHTIFTDFIDYMHSKVTELRGRADETARTVQSFAQQGLDSPPNLDRNFESLMLAVGKLYIRDDLKLNLCVEYWGPMELQTNYAKSTPRSVSLFKFIRLAGDLLPPILFVPYMKMLAGLSSSEHAARCAFNLLKQGSGLTNSTTISWDHFFGSLCRYYANLRQEQAPGTDTIYRNRALNRTINPQEIEGLHSVLEIIRVVANYDEIARISLCEHPNWAPLHVLIGLLSCSVPISLKADIMLTLSTLGKSKDTATQLWNNLEASQIIRTIPTTSIYCSGGLEAEIEQNESRNEIYPLTRATLDLFYTLVTVGVPRNLGVSPRKPGLDPYLTFIVDVIFLKFYNRNYKNVAEKWNVGEKCLKVLYHFIKTYRVNPIDFIEKKEENSAPGYHLMLQLHTKSDLLRLMLHVIDEARNSLDLYTPFAGKKDLESAALYCLNILEKTLSVQEQFFEAHSISNSSILLSGLNKLILDVNPRSGKPDHILNTTKFVTYNNWLPEHALVAVKLLNIVAKQPNVNPQILGMLAQSERIQTEICHGFVECFESDIIIEDENDQSLEKMIGDIQLGIKEAIIELIQDCLPQPAPNIALFLLGFDVNKDFRSSHIQKTSGILSSSNSCTRSLVSMLDKNLELIKSGVVVSSSEEKIMEKAYGLLYTLCSNQITFNTILRYLRSCNDFLCRHIAALPFQNYTSSMVLNQMSFLLKCIAIELKITADNNQVSQFSNLCKILLGIVQNNIQENIPFELSHYLSNTFTDTISDSLIVNKRNPSDQQAPRILICHLLNCLEFQMKTLPQPDWHYFDNTLTMSLLSDCEVKNKDIIGPKLIDIKKLHEILTDELNTVQSSIVAGQRQLIMEEIQSFLKYAVKVNEQKKSCVATIKFVAAWGQVTEILFSVSPNFALPLETKQELILEILQCLLSKVVPVEVMMELANITSATVLILMVNLKNCYNNKFCNANESSDKFHNISLRPNTHVKTFGTSPKSNTLSLKFILQNILEWIILSGVGSQKLRINLYASLLNFMNIVKGNVPDKESSVDNEFYVSRLDSSMTYHSENKESNQIHMVIEVFSSFGEKLIDILCHDCIGGLDICKMLALSCIDSLLDMDSFTNFVNFIAKRGYLTHLIDSLAKGDDSLCRVLKSIPDDMKALYVYESKMATLCRIGSSHIGAELLLENRALGTLSNMKVFDLHPDFQVNSLRRPDTLDRSLFVPSVETRYQQILFPALNLCDCIISTLGPENHSAVSQVIHFLLSHGETIEIVLRTGNPCSGLELLKELSGITGLIARSANQDICSLQQSLDQDISAQLYRLQRLILSLYPRFMLSETILKEMIKVNNNFFEENEKAVVERNKALHIKYFLEIACNLSMYCRNTIANHSADHRTTAILFSPSITESTVNRNDYRGNTLEITPSLGIVVNQLKYSVEYYNREKLIYDKLVRQKAGLPSITLDLSVQAQSNELAERINEKQSELNYCTFITEQCLYLLWAHLDFYMKRSIPINKLQFNARSLTSNEDTFISSPSEAGWKISVEDISLLKKNLISVLNETFCKQLIATTQSQNSSDKGFTEGLLRRIKSLVQFVSVN